MTNPIRIAVIGLGYVGLPLARLFATKYPVIGFDVNQNRVNELNQGIDHTLEVDAPTLKSALVTRNPVTTSTNGLFCSFDPEEIKNAISILSPSRHRSTRTIVPISPR